MAKLPLQSKGEGWFAFGAVQVNPTSDRYYASVGNAHGLVEYTGTISQDDGKWAASQPAVTYLDAKR